MRASTGSSLLEGRRVLTLILLAALIWSLTSVDWGRGVIHPGGAGFAVHIFSSIFTPDLSSDFLKLALVASWKTISFAVAGLTLAVLVGLPLGILASGVLAHSTAGRVVSVTGVRFVLGLLRSVHELVWAWLFVVAVGLSPIAGIFALAIPYAGILGRIYSDMIRDVPEEPLRALRATGASEFEVLVYGRLPMVLPDMLGYSFYRFECGIRSAAILSFIGIAGLGYQIQLSLDDLLYGQVWTLLFFLVGMISLVDLWSTLVRRSLTS